MSKILTIAFAAVFVALLALYAVAVWTGDVRWADTASIFIVPSSLGFLAAGLWWLISEDHQ